MNKLSLFTAVLVFIIITVVSAGCSSEDKNNGDSNYPEKSSTGTLQLNAWMPKIYLSDSTIYAGYSIWAMERETGVYLIDVSNPAYPSLTNTVSTSDSVQGIAFCGSSMHVLHHAYGIIDQWDSQLTEFNLSTLEKTARAITYDDFCNDIAIGDDYAYIANSSTDSMLVINLATYTDEAAYSMGSGSSIVKIIGNRAYLVGYSTALEIVDITSPASPAHLGSVANPYNVSPRDLCIFNNYALLSCGSYGVFIIDISDETVPKFVTYNEESGLAVQIKTQGNMIFLADQDSGVVVIDASEGIDNYVVKGICKTAYIVQGLTVSGNYVYATSLAASIDEIGVLEVFDVSDWLN